MERAINMESFTNETLMNMGLSLSNLVVKGTASAVDKKIRASKEEKNIDNLRATYDKIINEILLESRSSKNSTSI